MGESNKRACQHALLIQRNREHERKGHQRQSTGIFHFVQMDIFTYIEHAGGKKVGKGAESCLWLILSSTKGLINKFPGRGRDGRVISSHSEGYVGVTDIHSCQRLRRRSKHFPPLVCNQAPICQIRHPPPALEVNIAIICLQKFFYSCFSAVDGALLQTWFIRFIYPWWFIQMIYLGSLTTDGTSCNQPPFLHHPRQSAAC